MKTILVCTLVVLSLATAVIAPTSAFDSKEFWQEQDRSHF